MSKEAINSCPVTINILNNIPGLISASVSILEPGARINPHYGDTDAIIRCHLGLKIPAGLPSCGFRVGYEDRSWEQGKLLMFNDAAYHKAWNETDQTRIVLLFDIIRIQHEKQKKWICSKVRGSILYQYLLNQFGIKPSRNYFSKVCSMVFAAYYFLLFTVFLKSALLK